MKVRFDGKPMVSFEQLQLNAESAKARGLPKPETKKRPPLAIVGGGPSVASKVAELKRWKGDVWIIGTAFPWAVENGVKGTFFNIDPLPEQAEYAKGAENAILATVCDPSVFDAIPNVIAFELVRRADYCNHNISAAASTPVLALEMGYTQVVYFGCESSFDYVTHAYEYENIHSPEMCMWVRVGDMVYPTNPPFFMQAQELAELIRTCPLAFCEESGGLLRALTVDPEYDVIAVNKTLHDALDFTKNGEPVPKETSREWLPILEAAL